MLLKSLSFQLADFALNFNIYIVVDNILPVIGYYEPVVSIQYKWSHNFAKSASDNV